MGGRLLIAPVVQPLLSQCVMRASFAAIPCLLAACTFDPSSELSVDAAGGCAREAQVYQIDRVELPRSPSAASAAALDLDGLGGGDNQLGLLHAAIVAVSASWDVGPALTAHLGAGHLRWAVRTERCARGEGLLAVELARADDADGDGVLELLARGAPASSPDAVGADDDLRARGGVAEIPLGFLTDGAGDDGVALWVPGRAFAVELTRAVDGSLDGRLGFALGPIPDAALAPLARYATGALTDPSVGPAWRAQDRDRDGTISIAELRVLVDALVRADLDLEGSDGVADHLSAAVVVHATPVAAE